MRIAIPVEDGKLCGHFGHCSEFTILETDAPGRQIVRSSTHRPPPHEPGVIPVWLAEQGAEVVIAGGMGQSAQMLLAQRGITVVLGAPGQTPEQLATAYLTGTLQAEVNTCDHGSCHK